MKITFLGTGTSGGVPIIKCDCDVCRSDNPKNKRLRCSIMVEWDDQNILVDTSLDMREQFLRHSFPRLDAILYTHTHADHIFGLDEVRRFNYLQKQRIPVYGNYSTLQRLRSVFDYAFYEGVVRWGIPSLTAVEVQSRFSINGLKITPVPLLHGHQEILGYRFGNFAYCTDVNKIPESSYRLLQNLDVLVLDALREREHATHFCLSQSIAEARKIAARKTYFTHMSHNLDHEKHGRLLPENMYFAYDGLVLNF